PGIEELRSQSDFAVARRWSATDASIYLRVDHERAPRAVLAQSRYLEIAAWSRRGNEPGDPDLVELSLWAHEGWLESIEIVPYGDQAWPKIFPPPGAFESPEVNRHERDAREAKAERDAREAK